MEKTCPKCGKTYRVSAEPPIVTPDAAYATTEIVLRMRHGCGAEITTVLGSTRLDFYQQGPDGDFQLSNDFFFTTFRPKK